MQIPSIIEIILFSVTFYVSFICGFLHLRMVLKNESILGRKVLMLAVLASMASAGASLFLVLDIAQPRLYTTFNPFIVLVYMSINLLYYHFIFEMTKVYKNEHFPRIHYLFPILVSAIALVYAFVIPFESRLALMHGADFEEKSYRIYSLFFSAKPALYFIWKIAYAIFGLQRTIRYRKALVNYSADEGKTSLTWLYQFLFVMLAALPLGWAIVYFQDKGIATLILMFVLMLIVVFKDIILVHNVLLDNLVVICFETDEEEQNESGKEIKSGDVKRLEVYMLTKKPYLISNLKITEIAYELNSNRTYLSLLINRTYGMNFSRYVNRYRLQELERLKLDPDNVDISEVDMICRAGFSDYRAYKRLKEAEQIDI